MLYLTILKLWKAARNEKDCNKQRRMLNRIANIVGSPKRHRTTMAGVYRDGKPLAWSKAAMEDARNSSDFNIVDAAHAAECDESCLYKFFRDTECRVFLGMGVVFGVLEYVGCGIVEPIAPRLHATICGLSRATPVLRRQLAREGTSGEAVPKEGEPLSIQASVIASLMLRDGRYDALLMHSEAFDPCMEDQKLAKELCLECNRIIDDFPRFSEAVDCVAPRKLANYLAELTLENLICFFLAVEVFGDSVEPSGINVLDVY